MFNKIKNKIRKEGEIFALVLLILITIVSTTYYNNTKKKIKNNYISIINNVYFKKTINYSFNNLEPKFKKVSHQVKIGETFDNILDKYSIKKNEITSIKNKLSEKVDLNKLSTNHRILFTIDQSSNLIKIFILKISS